MLHNFRCPYKKPYIYRGYNYSYYDKEGTGDDVEMGGGGDGGGERSQQHIAREESDIDTAVLFFSIVHFFQTYLEYFWTILTLLLSLFHTLDCTIWIEVVLHIELMTWHNLVT